jgi:hypothetical protein
VKKKKQNTKERQLPTWAVSLLLTCVVIGAIVYQERGTNPQRVPYRWDFPAYYAAASFAREHPRQPLYPPTEGPGDVLSGKIRYPGQPPTMRFNSPPEMALVLAPLTVFSLATAYGAIRALNVILLAATCFLLHRQRWLLLMALAICSYPFYWCQGQGQFGAWVLFLWVAGTLAEERDRNWLSACCFGAATLIKMTPAVVIVLFALQRKWRWLGCYAAAISTMVAIGLAIQGMDNHIQYLRQVLLLSSAVAGWHSLSITGIIHNLWLDSPYLPDQTATLPLWLVWFTKIISGLGLVAIIWFRGSSSSLAIASVALSPFAWCHYYVIALFPFVRKWRTTPLMIGSAILIGTSFYSYLPTDHNVVLMAAARALPVGAALYLAFTQDRAEVVPAAKPRAARSRYATAVSRGN